MSSVVLSGDTSGTVTLTVPAVAGTNTVTVPAGTGTMAVQGVSTNIVSGTAVASTSGTAIDFTSIPSWVKRITVMFSGVSLSGTSTYLLQLGAGSTTTTGYTAYYSIQENSGTAIVYSSTSGFPVFENNAANLRYGTAKFVNISGNTWVCDGLFVGTSSSAVSAYMTTGGSIALSGTLDRIRITTANGTDTFDAGSINILYE